MVKKNSKRSKKAGSKAALAHAMQSPRAVLQWAGLTRKSTLALVLLLGVVLVSGLAVVNVTHANRFAFNELQELKEEAVDLNVAWGQLLIEQSTFGVEDRIEIKAAEQLQMQVPDVSDIVMVRQ
ncbi:MAG: cell division protein FtsL [Gammaproteobacteria bacterium]